MLLGSLCAARSYWIRWCGRAPDLKDNLDCTVFALARIAKGRRQILEGEAVRVDRPLIDALLGHQRMSAVRRTSALFVAHVVGNWNEGVDVVDGIYGETAIGSKTVGAVSLVVLAVGGEPQETCYRKGATSSCGPRSSGTLPSGASSHLGWSWVSVRIARLPGEFPTAQPAGSRAIKRRHPRAPKSTGHHFGGNSRASISATSS